MWQNGRQAIALAIASRKKPNQKSVKRPRKQEYIAEYTEQFPGVIKPSGIGKHYAHCTTCRSDFSIAASGLYDITVHVNANRHKNRSEIVQGQYGNKYGNFYFLSTEISLKIRKFLLLSTEIFVDRLAALFKGANCACSVSSFSVRTKQNLSYATYRFGLLNYSIL